MSETSWPAWLPLRADLQSLSPYGAPQISSVARLNTNENPYPPSPALAKAIAQEIESVASTLNRYPDRDLAELRKGLAQFLNHRSGTQISPDQIWAANGSNEILQSLFLAFGGEGALGFTPSYSMHSLISQVVGTKWSQGNRAYDFSIGVDEAITQINELLPKLIFVTTPNNPTGTAVPLADLERMAHAAAEISALLLVDEAYAEFSHERSAVTLLSKLPNLVVVRTMSKAFAFAGARVGYLAAHPDVVRAIQLVRLPYHMSAITQAIAVVALSHEEELLANVDRLVRDREWVAAQLRALGAYVVPSSANFLLFSVRSPGQIWQSLLDQGVLIRDVGLSGYLRVTIGNEAENQKFIESLAISLAALEGGDA